MKKGAIEWEYIAAIIILLALLVIILIFSAGLREKATELVSGFIDFINFVG